MAYKYGIFVQEDIYIYIRFSRFSYRENTKCFDVVIERERRWRNRKWIKPTNSETSGAENVASLNGRTGIVRIVNNRNMCCAKVDTLREISTSFGFRNYLRTRLNFSS